MTNQSIAYELDRHRRHFGEALIESSLGSAWVFTAICGLFDTYKPVYWIDVVLGAAWFGLGVLKWHISSKGMKQLIRELQKVKQ